MSSGLDANKAKTARRVVEVLEFFDEQNRQATVMDIARRYNRPQSSTSELLAILVEMGLLYKDPNSRSFKPTPRAAMLGSMFQPALVRDGRLSELTQRLRTKTTLGTAVMGMVGLQAQVFRWMEGEKPIATSGPNALTGGAQTPLHECAAGWLLLSTIPPERRAGMLRRLRAEAPDDRKFDLTELNARIEACGREGTAVGSAGFGASADMCAALLPAEPGERPMVLSLLYDSARVDTVALRAFLQRSVQDCVDAATQQVVDLEAYRAQAEDAARARGGERPRSGAGIGARA